jgi:AraC-like DNA-binding protein
MFMINYLLTPDAFWMETGAGGPGPVKKISKLNNIIFSSNQSEFAFNVRAGARARVLDICFTYEWLLRQYPANNKDSAASVISRSEQQQPVFFETFSIDDYRMVSEIMEKVLNNEWDIIFFKSRVLTLMGEVLKNIFNKKSTESGRTPVHADLMMEVEKKLNSILHEKLPNLKEIAKEFSMSDSTLKRQFKQVYGKAVYEYYLYKKMELAKRMLLEKDMTISQVAYSLGYEKASPFIRVFKKQFGVPPGSLRSSHNTHDFSLQE